MRAIRYILLLMILSVVWWGGCSRSGPPPTTEVVVVNTTSIPLDPNDKVWQQAPEHIAGLILQDLVEPRLLQSSTTEVHVKALTNGSELAVRLEWIDSTKNDLPGAARFNDACAIQLPAKIESTLPAPQMGEQGRGVEITFWRADWQASVDGRSDSITAIYPNAAIDHYPFEAKSLEKNSPAQQEMAARYAPARALDNRRAGPRETPVEDLLAEGPGTLSPAPPSGSKGKGVHTDKGWAVVISRRLPKELAPQTRSQIAFAVWEGSHGEVGARKMRTGWIPILMKGEK